MGGRRRIGDVFDKILHKIETKRLDFGNGSFK